MGKSVSGSPTFRLSQKLIGLEGELRKWNREVVENIFIESKRLEGEISNWAIDEERGLPTSQEVNLHYALSPYHNILSQQELF